MIGKRFLLFLVCLIVSFAINANLLCAQEKPEVVVQLGHDTRFTHIDWFVFSPDGKNVLSFSKGLNG